MNTSQVKLIKQLIDKYGGDITLSELLKIKDNTPINNVQFNLSGVYKYAYEMTGEHFNISGTIQNIIWHNFGGEITTESVKTPLVDILDDEEIQELALFFIGEREETHRDFTNVSQSREVTVEEIEEYLKTLYVNENFDYNDTIESF